MYVIYPNKNTPPYSMKKKLSIKKKMALK